MREHEFGMRIRHQRCYTFSIELAALSKPDNFPLVNVVSIFAPLSTEALMKIGLQLISDNAPLNAGQHIKSPVDEFSAQSGHVNVYADVDRILKTI